MILIVGPPGVGKTSFVAQFTPGNSYWIIDPKETGVLDLMESRSIQVNPQMIHKPIKEFGELTNLLFQIRNNQTTTIPQNALTIILESVTGFELEARDFCCRKDYGNDWSPKGFMNFQDGYRQTANGHWSPMMQQLCALREMGFNIIMSGHSTVAKEKNQSGVDYLRETCACDYRVWDATHPFFENVFFLSYDVSAERENKRADVGVGKVKDYSKVLHVVKTPYQDAKNRIGLKKDISADVGADVLYRTMCQQASLNPLTLRYLWS